jgi:hypothetical protein
MTAYVAMTTAAAVTNKQIPAEVTSGMGFSGLNLTEGRA